MLPWVLGTHYNAGWHLFDMLRVRGEWLAAEIHLCVAKLGKICLIGPFLSRSAWRFAHYRVLMYYEPLIGYVEVVLVKLCARLGSRFEEGS